MSHEVVVVASAGISPFRLGIPSAVFGQLPHYRVSICARTPGVLPTDGGFDVTVDRGLEALATADTVVIPSWDPRAEVPLDLCEALTEAHDRGARVIGLCLGAFAVAAAGLADGREVATHWAYADLLARRHPAVRVRSDVLWTDLGDVVTSAGNAAGLDCCLHVVRQDLGAAVARDVARGLVLAPHREGSQAQFVPGVGGRVDPSDPLGPATEWMLHRLADPVTLDEWATASGMSRRTFTRRFRTELGTSPHQWLLGQRLTRAKDLLESADGTVETIARSVGLGTGASLRQHFVRRYGTTPSAHREAFAPRGVAAVSG
jgi:transcriptional regulator GlxA family with amidase domain